MSILVTGGTGFVGSFFVRKLASEGQNVVIYDISARPDLLKGVEEKVKIVRGDILDLPTILRTIKDNSIDKIVHIGAMTKVDSDDNPFLSFRINGEGTLNLLEASRILNNKRFVLMSSMDVYDEGEVSTGEPVAEGHTLNPIGMIGVAKLAGENCGIYYSRAYGLDFVALRFTAIFGPGKTMVSRHTELTVEDAVENAMQGKDATIAGPAKDLLYIRDAANALYLAATKTKLLNHVYNIGSGKLTKPSDVAHAVNRVFPQVNIGYKDSENKTMLLNTKRAQTELGFNPQYDLEKAIRDYVDHRKRFF
jgi:nucleoside-diphosphate-sugar epimerase